MWHNIKGLVKTLILYHQRGGNANKESDGEGIEAFERQGDHPFELVHIVLDGGHGVEGVPGDLGVFLAEQPLAHDVSAMGQSTSHVLDSGAQGQTDALFIESLNIPA